MGSGSKKKKSNPMGDYIPTESQMEAYINGVRNGVRISPKGCPGGNEWFVEVFAGNKWQNSGKKYGPVEVWEVVYNYYEHYNGKKM